jgi:hypothetical protein
MYSVLAPKERSGVILAADPKWFAVNSEGDIKRRRIRVAALRSRHYAAAEMLLGSYGSVHGLRTLDSLRLACALDLYRNQLIDSMVTRTEWCVGSRRWKASQLWTRRRYPNSFFIDGIDRRPSYRVQRRR